MRIFYEFTHIEKKSQAKFQETNQFENEYNETAELLYEIILPSNNWVIFHSYLLKNQSLYVHLSKYQKKTPSTN